MKKSLLLLIVLCITAGLEAQLSKTVEITAGGLGSALTASEKASVTELIVTGTINSNDFSQIRSYMPLLEKLDISGTTITNNILPQSALQDKTKLKEVILHESITTIDTYSFYNCHSLTTVNMPDSLRQINHAAFFQCYELSVSLVLPPKVNKIDSYAFYRCYKINSLSLSDSLTTFGSYAFQQCSTLNGHLELPAKVTTMGNSVFEGTNYSTAKLLTPVPPAVASGGYFSMSPIRIFYVLPEAKTAFRNDTKWNPYIIIGGDSPVKITIDVATAGTLGELALQQVEYLKDVNELTISGQLNAADITLLKDNFPDLISLNIKNTNITDIPANQFQNRSYLRYVVLPDSLMTLGNSAFYRCYDLQEIVIPQKVKNIGDYTFYECTELRRAVLPVGIVNLKTHAFAYNYLLSKIILPDSLMEIGDYTFYQNYELDSVIIPSKITTINYASFYDCKKLKYVKFPDRLSKIRNYAFNNCPIDTLIFPTTLQTIEAYAFQSNSVLKHIVCQQPTPPVLSTDPFNQVQKTTCTLEVPFWSMNMYKQAPIWTNFATVIPFNKELKEIPISGPLTLLNNIRPTGFPNITVMSNGSLSVGGNAPLPTDRFVIEGRYNSTVFGNLMNDCPAMSANSVTVRLEVNNNKWYFWSFPYDIKVSDISTSNNALIAIRRYNGAARAANGTGGSWKNMTADSTLKAGQGYIFNTNAVTTLILPATSETRNMLFNPEEKSTALTAYNTGVTANKNWNFIGNAYPSYYDSRYLDFTAPITVWNLSNNTYTAISLIDDKYAIKPFEGFFVQKPEDISQMTYLKGGRQLTATLAVNGPSGMPQRAPSNPDRLRIDLSVSNSNITDLTRVVFNPIASMEYEIERDASKFFSNDPTVPQLYSLGKDATPYAINERPAAEGWVALGFYAGNSGNYSIQKEENTSQRIQQLMVEDRFTNTTADLLTGSYNFTSESGTFNDRFILRIGNIATNNEEVVTDTHVYGVKGKLIIRAERGSQFRVYSLSGLLLHQLLISDKTTEINLPAGIYLIRSEQSTVKTVVF